MEAAAGPVLFGYDGSDLAKGAIEAAARLLAPGGRAVVLTVWQPFNVGFVTPGGLEMNAAATEEVKAAAEQTAAQGAEVAQAQGFKAESMAKEGAPTKKGILEVADQLDASLIVLGSHGRSGMDVVLGSVAQGVSAHSRRPVLIVH